MSWQLLWSKRAARELAKMDRMTQRVIIAKMRRIVEESCDPRASGKALSGNLREYWRYRVGDWRVICEIHDSEATVTAIEVGHRRDVYRR